MMGWDGRGSQCWLIWAGVMMILTSFILGQGAGESKSSRRLDTVKGDGLLLST